MNGTLYSQPSTAQQTVMACMCMCCAMRAVATVAGSLEGLSE